MEKQVTLTPLAVSDLSLSYARMLGGNKIRHYTLRLAHCAGQLPSIPKLIEQHIMENEGERVQIIINDKSIAGSDLSAKDVTEHVLGGLKGAIRKLKARQPKTHLLQYKEVADFNYFAKFAYPDKKAGATKVSFKEKLAMLAAKIGLSRLVPAKYKVNLVSPVSYLSYHYDEKNEKLAFDALRKDLKVLSDRNLILGSLAVPSTIVLADTIGNGSKRKVVFCFPYLNYQKLSYQAGIRPGFDSVKPLNSIGIHSATYEGGIGPFIGNKEEFDIEIVYVNPSSDKK